MDHVPLRLKSDYDQTRMDGQLHNSSLAVIFHHYQSDMMVSPVPIMITDSNFGIWLWYLTGFCVCKPNVDHPVKFHDDTGSVVYEILAISYHKS